MGQEFRVVVWMKWWVGEANRLWGTNDAPAMAALA